jgi:hypothetical protein
VLPLHFATVEDMRKALARQHFCPVLVLGARSQRFLLSQHPFAQGTRVWNVLEALKGCGEALADFDDVATEIQHCDSCCCLEPLLLLVVLFSDIVDLVFFLSL